MPNIGRRIGRKILTVAGVLSLLAAAAYAGNQVMGEIEFHGKSKVENSSGVWVDGQYVGYLKELKGSKKVLLLPGEHLISVRQDGYQDFTQRIEVRAGEKQVVDVTMARAAGALYPKVTSTVKISVNPPRAAVFLDGQFIGHVAEFEGMGHGLLVSPGPHKIRVALPGYQTFETEINPQPKQKVEVKTDLMKDTRPEADPMLNQAGPQGAAMAPAQTQPAQPIPPPERAQPPSAAAPATQPPPQAQTPAQSMSPAQMQRPVSQQPQINQTQSATQPAAQPIGQSPEGPPPPPDRVVWPNPPAQSTPNNSPNSPPNNAPNNPPAPQ